MLNFGDLSGTDTNDVSRELEEQHNAEMARLHGLWNKTSVELKKKAVQLAELDKSRKHNEKHTIVAHNSRMKKLEESMTELRDRFRYQEVKLQRAKEEKSEVDERCVELERLLHGSRIKEKEDISRNSITASEVKALAAKVRKLSQEKEYLLNRSHSEIKSQEHELREKLQTIAMQNAKLNVREEELHYLMTKSDKDKEKMENLQEKLKEREAGSKQYKRKCRLLEEELDSRKGAKRAIMKAEVDMERVRESNRRLMQLLTTTKDFKGMFNPDVDSGSLTKLSFVPVSVDCYEDDSVDRRAAMKELIENAGRAKILENDRPIIRRREGDYWIPDDVFKIANEFKHTYLPHISLDIFRDLLVKMNKVWKSKERQKVLELKSKHRHELKEYRRTASFRQPYDVVIYEDKIKALKKEVTSSRKIHGEQSGTNQRILEDSLSNLETLTVQLSRYREENQMLRARLETMVQSKVESAMHENDEHFVGRKSVALLEKLAGKFEELKETFLRSRDTTKIPSGAEMLLDLQRAFVEDVEKEIFETRNKVRTILSASLDFAKKKEESDMDSEEEEDEDLDGFSEDDV